MDCEFCNVAPAEHCGVPTSVGRLADLCDSCLARHGRRPPSALIAPLQARSSSQKLLWFGGDTTVVHHAVPAR